MPEKRLVYLCLETPRPGQATYTHVHEIVGGLRDAGWDVALIATRVGGAASGSPYWSRGLDYVAAQLRMLRELPNADAVYMRAHFAALPASLWARLRGKPVIQEINGLPQDIFVTYPWLRMLGWIVKASYRLQLRGASHVVVVTEGLSAWARGEGGHDRVSLVGNGANTQVFSPEGSRPETRGPYVAFVGGLTAWHGIDVMVAATRRAEWPEGVRLVIIGDGKESEKVQAAMLADKAGRIVWLGRLPQQQVAIWLRGALAALSITQDRQDHLGTGVAPLKLFEAMASGVPVIVTDLPFQAELVRREQTGLVIPMEDAEALAEAVAVLAADPAAALAMGARGAAHVRLQASWRLRAEQTSRIIDGVIDGG